MPRITEMKLIVYSLDKAGFLVIRVWALRSSQLGHCCHGHNIVFRQHGPGGCLGALLV